MRYLQTALSLHPARVSVVLCAALLLTALSVALAATDQNILNPENYAGNSAFEQTKELEFTTDTSDKAIITVDPASGGLKREIRP
ncbi:MAG TPA: hypothetical protein VNA68_01225 [Candidatus Dormibacteraeota bacterium]|nr:hypothetical protein [Candidatus Dormibacteraeota bacterium]